jgi:hypothetical protein
MNKTLTLLIAAAIISPAFALDATQTRTPVLALIAQNPPAGSAEPQNSNALPQDVPKPMKAHHPKRHHKKVPPPPAEPQNANP